jgi:delta(3,5)-delta(2,4)-dienoyl-CoA isomerase
MVCHRADTWKSRLSKQEVNVGLAADIGTLQRFPKVTGNDSKSRELALTGRKFGAVEAKEMGFVSEVIEGGRREVVGRSSLTRDEVQQTRLRRIAKALEMGRVIAEKSPVAVVSTKHLMNRESRLTVELTWLNGQTLVITRRCSPR